MQIIEINGRKYSKNPFSLEDFKNEKYDLIISSNDNKIVNGLLESTGVKDGHYFDLVGYIDGRMVAFELHSELSILIEYNESVNEPKSELQELKDEIIRTNKLMSAIIELYMETGYGSEERRKQIFWQLEKNKVLI